MKFNLEPKEYENKDNKKSESTNAKQTDLVRKESILKSSENRSLEPSSSSKDLSYSGGFTYSQPKEATNNKEENTYNNANEYFSDIAKYSNTKLAKNSILDSNNPIEVQLEGNIIFISISTVSKRLMIFFYLSRIQKTIRIYCN